MSWRAEAPCNGVTDLFYEDAHEARARAICEGCAYRKSCMIYTLDHEQDVANDERFGIAAGMNPAQRISLVRRGRIRCSCGKVRDPIQLRDGVVACNHCRTHEEVPPIPEEGDRWAKRHTTLARKVIAHLADNPGAVPSPAAMSRTLRASEADMQRVYRGLHAEGTLQREGRKYARAARTGASFFATYPDN